MGGIEDDAADDATKQTTSSASAASAVAAASSVDVSGELTYATPSGLGGGGGGVIGETNTPPPIRSQSPAFTPDSAAGRIATLNDRFAATISKHSISQQRRSQTGTPKTTPGTPPPVPGSSDKDLPVAPTTTTDEDQDYVNVDRDQAEAEEEIAQLETLVTALTSQLEQLSSAPTVSVKCPCCLLIDLDDPSSCATCKGTFAVVVQLQKERARALEVLEDERQKLQVLNEKERVAQEDAAKLGERVGELEKIMDTKAEEQARIQRDMQKMGEKIIEEIEKRAELQVARDSLQDELEELTKSLFEEANVMVADEARKRHMHETREKSLEKQYASLKTQLQMEQLQLRELQIKMEEAETRSAAAAAAAASSTAASSQRPRSESSASISGISRAGSQASINIPPVIDPVDPMLLAEFEDFLKHGPTVKLNKLHTLSFMKNVIEDDVTACLRFGGNPRTSTKKLIDAILMNSCLVEEMSAAQISSLKFQHQCLKEAMEPGSPALGRGANAKARASGADPEKATIVAAAVNAASAPTQSIFQKTVLERWSTTWSSLAASSSSSGPTITLPPSIILDGCSTCGKIGTTRHHFKISEQADDTWCPICGPCRDRLVAVCEFYNFVRHVRQGLYSTRRHEDMYLEVQTLKRKMFFARISAYPFLAAERPFASRAMLRPDSQLLKDFEMTSAAAALDSMLAGGSTNAFSSSLSSFNNTSNTSSYSTMTSNNASVLSSSSASSLSASTMVAAPPAGYTGSSGLQRMSIGAALRRINEDPALAPSVNTSPSLRNSSAPSAP